MITANEARFEAEEYPQNRNHYFDYMKEWELK